MVFQKIHYDIGHGLGMKDVPDQPHQQNHEREKGKDGIGRYRESVGMRLRSHQVPQRRLVSVLEHVLPGMQKELGGRRFRFRLWYGSGRGRHGTRCDVDTAKILTELRYLRSVV